MGFPVRTFFPARLGELLILLGLAAVYFAAAKLGLSLAFVAEQVTAVWPPTGIALAALLRYGYRVWPGIALGAFLANVTANEPVGVALGIATGNTLEALCGAWLLWQIPGFQPDLHRLRDALGLAFLAAGASALIAATIGTTSLYLGMENLQSSFREIWQVWWLGDALGTLVVAPPLLTLNAKLWRTSTRERLGEAVLLMLTLAVVAVMVFTASPVSPRSFALLEFEYLVFPFVIWAALRLGPPGTSTVTLLTTVIAVWGTVHGLGPFARGSVHDSLLLLQSFMAAVAIAALLLGAGIAELRREVLERRRLEGELRRHAAELLEGDRRKDEFLAMLAHELRNPLAPIQTAAHLARLKGPLEPDLQWANDVIVRQAQHLTRLVDDLLDVSRITRGKIHLQKQRVDVAAVVARAVEACRPLLDARKHTLHMSTPVDPVEVEGDPTRLSQIVANLLNNAAKYTEEGGHIRLTLERSATQAIVHVRDNGIGISADLLPHVFDLFVQADRSLDRAQGGLGIGLTLVKSLVEAHGGTVTATSDGIGKGSEFSVQLPLAVAAAAHVNGASSSPKGAVARRRILIVDDNTDAAQSLGAFMRLAGHETRVTYDGPAALSAAGEFNPDVVLLDIGLPGMSGYDVARHLRAQAGNLLLIAVTGYGQEEDRQRAREAGFDHHFVKPVDPEILGALLQGNAVDSEGSKLA
jgi:signal transduction histidine kinase/CheY-like chemotaxis protein